MSDLAQYKGKKRAFSIALIEGRTLHVVSGNIGELEPSTKSKTFRTPAAVQAAYRAHDAELRAKGYSDARPAVGAPTFIASKHPHADVVYVDGTGGLACSLCEAPISAVEVAATPARRVPPQMKKTSSRDLEKEHAKLERLLWGDLVLKNRDKLERQSTRLQEKIDEIHLKNAIAENRWGAIKPVDAAEFQATYLWPLAKTMGIGAKLTSAALLAKLRTSLAADTLARSAAAILESSKVPVWRALVKRGAGGTDHIGGAPKGLAAGSWPSCPRCDEAMDFVAQFRAGPGTGIPLARLAVVYVFRCAEMCWDSQFESVVVQRGALSTARSAKRRAQLAPELPLTFEQGTEVRPPGESRIRDEIKETMAALLYGAMEHGSQTKLGGRPHFIQGWGSMRSPKCPECKKPMLFAAQIDSLMHPSLVRRAVFGDGGAGYLYLCATHDRGSFEVQSC